MTNSPLAMSMILFSDLTACNVNVCLTWEAEKEKVTFKCRVSRLQWRLYFYNPDNTEEGHCLNPVPFSSCHSSNNNLISQNTITNTTFLLINGRFQKKIIGTWKCLHGTERDEANVNVSVINTGNVLVYKIFTENLLTQSYLEFDISDHLKTRI